MGCSLGHQMSYEETREDPVGSLAGSFEDPARFS